VVAKNANRLLYNDDVEEDFGVAIPDVDGVLRNCGNHSSELSLCWTTSLPSTNFPISAFTYWELDPLCP